MEKAETAAWTCKKCAEHVPENFTVCWKCGTTREGLEDPGFVSEFLDASDKGEPEVVSEYEEAREPELLDGCAKCGSIRVIPDVRVVGHGEESVGGVRVVVYGNPEALLFKDRCYGEVRADICGKCGHLELRVHNARELHKHYRESLKR